MPALVVTNDWLEIVPRRSSSRVVLEPLLASGTRVDLESLAVALARECASLFWLDSGLDVGPGTRVLLSHSPQGDEPGGGRFSFLGAEPVGRFRNRGVENELWWDGQCATWRGDPFSAVQRIVERRAVAQTTTLPGVGVATRAPAPFPGLKPGAMVRSAGAVPPGRLVVPFIGGAVGYFGYDLRHHVERLPRSGRDDLGLPDCALAFYDAVLAYDHVSGQLTLCSVNPGGAAAAKLRAIVGSRQYAVCSGEEGSFSLPTAYCLLPTALKRNFTRPAYLRAVRRVLDYIAAGDIYQVNLSQRFSTEYAGDTLDLYRRLRRQTPAPFAAYLGFDDMAILSASPERFLRIRGRDVVTRPIKGTRPRGRTPEEDRRLAAELLASEKDRAELVMIVDLERNDLGKVCEYGSVHVPELVRLEEHPTVFHLVATVAGRLRPDVTPVECLRACFPGGSITGAPKIRAMEIIEELEPTRRGPYTGAIGYLGWDGTVDLNIAIRTIVVANAEAHFQVGGGIVADSEPEAEYEETLHKGRALMRALGVTDR